MAVFPSLYKRRLMEFISGEISYVNKPSGEFTYVNKQSMARLSKGDNSIVGKYREYFV